MNIDLFVANHRKITDKIAVRLAVIISFLAIITISAAELPCQYEQAGYRSANIYERGSDCTKPLIKMRRTVAHSGNQVNVTRDFLSTTVETREHVTYQGDDLVYCDMEFIRTGEKGSARVVRKDGKAELLFDYTSSSGKHKTTREDFESNTINNDMVGPFIVAHWKELMNGDPVKCRYLALTRSETIAFEFTKTGETTIKGKPFVIVKMTASSAFIAAFVDPLIFTIEKDGDHRCLQYDGRTPVKTKDGNKEKDVDGITVFDW